MVLRISIAVAAELALIGLVLTAPRDPGPNGPDLALVLYPLALLLAIGAAGLVGRRFWGRWLGLAAALAVLPWAVAFLAGPDFGQPMARPWITLSAALALLVSLGGRRAVAAFEEPGEAGDRAGRRMALVPWAVITNLAAIANLYVFAAAYRPAAAWQAVIPGGLAAGLAIGVWLLARGRTLGLLALAAGVACLPPAVWYFLARQAVSAPERALFVAVLLPGWLAGAATLAAFAGPLWRFARD